MTARDPKPFDGGCDCRAVRYRMTTRAAVRALLPLPLVPARDRRVVRAQRDDRSRPRELLSGEPEIVDTPSNSGKGQKIARCPTCRIAVWSNYAGAGDAVRFVRVGTLDEPDRLPPDIHIFTASKQPWVVLPPGMPAVAEYYDRDAATGRRRASSGARRCWRESHEAAASRRTRAASGRSRPSAAGCEDCLAIGAQWTQLRTASRAVTSAAARTRLTRMRSRIGTRPATR